MAFPKYTASRFSKLSGGKNLVIVVLVAIGFWSLYTYRQNSPLPLAVQAPNIRLATADGQSFELYDIRTPVVLVFYSDRRWFANNMYPIMYNREMPALRFLQEEGKAQIIILIKDINTEEKLKAYYEKKDKFYLENISFVYHNLDAPKLFGIRSWPHTFVLDGNHRVRYSAKILSYDSIRKALEVL